MVSLGLPPTASTKWLKRPPSCGVAERRQIARSNYYLIRDFVLQVHRDSISGIELSTADEAVESALRRVSRGEHASSEAGRPGGNRNGCSYKTCSSDIPPVHVAADHEVGRAVPEVDAGEVAKRVAQLREAAFCFQAVDQDLGRRKMRVPCYIQQPYINMPYFSTFKQGLAPAPSKDVLPLNTLTFSREWDCRDRAVRMAKGNKRKSREFLSPRYTHTQRTHTKMPNKKLGLHFLTEKKGWKWRSLTSPGLELMGKRADPEACSQPARVLFLLLPPVFIPREVQERTVQASRRMKPAQLTTRWVL